VVLLSGANRGAVGSCLVKNLVRIHILNQESQTSSKNRILMLTAESHYRLEIDQFANIVGIVIDSLINFMEIESGGTFVTAQCTGNLTNSKPLLHL
jgi:hypothetical protein